MFHSGKEESGFVCVCVSCDLNEPQFNSNEIKTGTVYNTSIVAF